MNAKDELIKILEHFKITAKIVCADLILLDEKIVLKCNYTEKDYYKFLEELDKEYDDGFGGQELDGTIWLDNGTWLERGEYDGSEWWEYKKYPEIPLICK